MEYEIRSRSDSTYLLEIAAALLDLDRLSDIEHKRLSEVVAFVFAAPDNHLKESTVKAVINTLLDNLNIKLDVLSVVALSKANPYYWLERISE